MKWISVEGRLPEYEKKVLLLINGEEVVTGSSEPDEVGISYRIGNDSFSWDYHFNLDISVEEITHWQPLPAPLE